MTLPTNRRRGASTPPLAGWLGAAAALVALSAVAAPAATLPTAACPLPPPALQQGGVQALWAVAGTPVAVGRHFAIDVQLCPTDARLVRVDATMPAHRHGMNYRPSVTAAGPGRWRAEGLMFHMPGRWELRLEVRTADGTEQLRDSVTLP